MKQNLLLLYSVLTVTLQGCLSQEAKFEQIRSRHKKYLDFVIYQDYIIAIDYKDNLVLINPNSNELQTKETGVIALSRLEDKIVIAKRTGELKNYNIKKDKWSTLGKSEHDVLFITTIREEIFLITESGIVDFATHKKYIYDNSLNPQIQYGMRLNPTVVSVDNEDNIWLGFDYGEWGGDLMVFSTSQKK